MCFQVTKKLEEGSNFTFFHFSSLEVSNQFVVMLVSNNYSFLDLITFSLGLHIIFSHVSGIRKW